MKIPILLAVAAAGVLLVLWLFVGRGEELPPTIAAERTSTGETAALSTELVAPETVAPDERASAAENEAGVASPLNEVRRRTIMVTLRDPSNRELRSGWVRIRLLRDGRELRRFEMNAAGTIRIPVQNPGRYEVRALLEGYDEGVAPRVDVPEEEGTSPRTICVTPENWVGVIVQDSNGRSVADWSTDWGGQTKHFFRGSFRVFVATTPPAPAGPAPSEGEVQIEGEVESAGQGCTPSGCIGFVSRKSGAPAWIGLECLGVFLGWELASPTARSVAFVLDPSRIAAQFAELRFRVLHEETRLPALEAKIALLSDSSKHRRDEQKRVQLDRDGVALLQRIYPEDYELRIEMQAPAVSSEVVRRLVLAPGEHRDLGDILVRSDPPIRVRVVDEAGQDVDRACVQVGPLEPGTDEDSVYSIHGQPRYWNADRNGVISVPRPSFRAVVRGLRMRGDQSRGWMPEQGGLRSSNVIVDEQVGSAEILVLVLREPTRVDITHVQEFAKARVEIRDEVGIVVGTSQLGAEREWTIELVPGSYEAIVSDEHGKELARASFLVGGERTSVELH